jgi:peptidoglycan/LPS O-acetylase OafA/YrhL
MAKKTRRQAAVSGGSPAPASRPAPRVDYGALEGWRGICACLVAMYHFRSAMNLSVNAHLLSGPIIGQAYLFVDFFFVLSGFVITASYQERLVHARIGLAAFLKLRLGRLYPMHLFSLLVMMAIAAVLRNTALPGLHMQVAPLDTRIESLLSNLLLLQGLHTTPGPTWNHPSWSVSTEFATYVVYALLWKSMKRRTWIASAFIIVAAPVGIALLVGHIDTTFDWGILRSLLGFALGVIVYNALRRPRACAASARVGPKMASALEIGMLIAVVAFVAQPDHTMFTIAAPFVFALAVAVFSYGRGVVSSLFASPPLRHVGAISYSVYLLHWPLQMAFMLVAKWSDTAFGWSWLFMNDPVRQLPILGPSKFVGDAATVAMLAALLAASTVTYRFIETPWRARVRAQVAHA